MCWSGVFVRCIGEFGVCICVLLGLGSLKNWRVDGEWKDFRLCLITFD